jgi:hypothetical protein
MTRLSVSDFRLVPVTLSSSDGSNTNTATTATEPQHEAVTEEILMARKFEETLGLSEGQGMIL